MPPRRGLSLYKSYTKIDLSSPCSHSAALSRVLTNVPSGLRLKNFQNPFPWADNSALVSLQRWATTPSLPAQRDQQRDHLVEPLAKETRVVCKQSPAMRDSRQRNELSGSALLALC